MPVNSSKTIIALFNYGGGMRGLVPAHIMTKMEKVTGLRMADMVDVFCGPSTGSILNAAMNIPHTDDPTRPMYRARHMVRFYEREGDKIFPPDRFRDFRGLIHDFNNRTMKLGQLNSLFRHGHYDNHHLNKVLKTLYGDTLLADSLRSLIIPVYNIDGNQLEITEEPGETENSPAHTKNNFVDRGGHALWLKNMRLNLRKTQAPIVRVHDAVMASTAAPTYFPCHHFEVDYHDQRGLKHFTGIDGSIFDNPCVSYHGAIRQHIPEDYNLIMITLGTGHTLRSFKKEDWNRYGSLGVVDPVNDLPLINILFHASESALIESFEQEMGDNVYSFNKSLISGADQGRMPSTQIDNASPENLKRMRNFAEEMIEENRAKFDKVCDLMVRNYETRAENEDDGLWNIIKRKLGPNDKEAP